MYRIESENFLLQMEGHFFLEDRELPVNMTLALEVESNGFRAAASMDLDMKAFVLFAQKLNMLYTTLRGSARLQETYGSNYILFTALPSGHVRISGKLGNHSQNGFFQELLFENELDQTFLGEFSRKLFHDSELL